MMRFGIGLYAVAALLMIALLTGLAVMLGSDRRAVGIVILLMVAIGAAGLLRMWRSLRS